MKIIKKIMIHSFKGGTGKTNLIVNLATILALKGIRVGIVDLDWRAPSQHLIFNLDEKDIQLYINSFFSGSCQLKECAVDLTRRLNIKSGALYLFPASHEMKDILGMHKLEYEVDDLTVGIDKVMKELKLNIMLLDSHPGLDESALFGFLICDMVILVSRLDKQDYVGVKVIIKVLEKLFYDEFGKEVFLLINQIPHEYSLENVTKEFERIYDRQVISAIPFHYDVFAERSRSVLCLKTPNHPFCRSLSAVAEKLLTTL